MIDSSETDKTRQPVVRVVDLVKRFDERAVLDGVNIEVYRGEMVVIMGGSGCGKSTLLRHMIGSLEPNEGRVELFDQDISLLSERELDQTRKRFGVLFQSGALFNSMTVGENVALPLKEHTDLDAETIDIMVKIKLEQVGLREAAGLIPAEISGGMKKRAGLARALALDPQVLFYDEPSAGLDPVTSAEIDRLIIALSKDLGVTSIVVTHEMDSAFAVGDRMAMLERGRMLMIDTREAFVELRDWPQDRLGVLDDRQLTIRQFIRGDAEGPITRRKEATNYAEDLLGGVEPESLAEGGPAVESTRSV